MPPLLWIFVSATLLVLPLVLAYFAPPVGDDSFATALFRVPVALAIDIVVVSLSSVFVPLALATLASRAVYIVGFAVWRIRHAAKREHDARVFAFAFTAAAITICGSLELAWHFTIWDRGWHMPLVASLEGQSLPFANALDRGSLSYHLGGDLIAAMARALSFDHLSSASALSLVHDVFIGLAVAWLIALCRALGTRTLGAPMLLSIALAFHGAIPSVIGVIGKDTPFFSFSQLSYRPHAPVSLLAGTMLVGAFVSRIIAPRIRGAHAAMASAVLVASLCDEASVGIYGLAIGITWVVFPRVIARTRLRGAGFMVVLLLAVVVPNLLITRTIGHGGVVRGLRWVAPRFAGLEGGETPLFSLEGVFHGAMWLAAPLLALIAIALSRGVKRPLVVFVAATFFIALGLALCLVVNGSAGEAQRFYLAMFIVPLVVLILLWQDVRPALSPFVILGVVTPAILSVYSDWAISWRLRGSENASGGYNDQMPFSIFDVDCADVAPFRLGERPRRMYIDRSGHSLYASCRSLWIPGNVQAGWGIEIFEDTTSARQKITLERNVVGKTAPAACWNNYPSDAVCKDLKARGLCTPSDRYFVECTLPLTGN